MKFKINLNIFTNNNNYIYIINKMYIELCCMMNVDFLNNLSKLFIITNKNKGKSKTILLAIKIINLNIISLLKKEYHSYKLVNFIKIHNFFYKFK